MCASIPQRTGAFEITFLGAAQTVTGSCTLLETETGSVLIDCGMYQGAHEPDQLKRLMFSPRRLHAVIVTHAHIDHCGLLPWLCAHGFGGPIFATSATRDLCQILLADSARLQQEEAAYDLRRGRKTSGPLYTQSDVDLTMSRFVPIEHNWPFQPLHPLTVTFHDAGHILGAASIHIATETREIVFSGDIGPRGRPVMGDPKPPPHAHYVVTEATYGDRLHPSADEARSHLASSLLKVAQRGGVAIIPVFAVGRAQTLLYELGELMRTGQIPTMPVFLDSPLAIEAVSVFRRHTEYFDPSTNSLLARGVDPLFFPNLNFCRTVEESKALNDLEGPAVIFAGSGMCTGGRVRHHLRHRLPNHKDAVIFVGYQAEGTLGRILSDGTEKVKLYGEWVSVKAEIINIAGFSAHADQKGLLQWLAAIQGVEKVFINHSEKDVAPLYAQAVTNQTGLQPVLPTLFSTYQF